MIVHAKMYVKRWQYSIFLSLKVYGSMDIVNIVESAHYSKVGNWCKNDVGADNACENSTHWVKPFRCLGKLKIS